MDLYLIKAVRLKSDRSTLIEVCGRFCRFNLCESQASALPNRDCAAPGLWLQEHRALRDLLAAPGGAPPAHLQRAPGSQSLAPEKGPRSRVPARSARGAR